MIYYYSVLTKTTFNMTCHIQKINQMTAAAQLHNSFLLQETHSNPHSAADYCKNTTYTSTAECTSLQKDIFFTGLVTSANRLILQNMCKHFVLHQFLSYFLKDTAVDMRSLELKLLYVTKQLITPCIFFKALTSFYRIIKTYCVKHHAHKTF